MKNIVKIIVLLTALIMGACTDLTEDPKGLLAPEGFFKTPEDVLTGIRGIYGRMASSGTWGGETQEALMLLGDMVDLRAGAAQSNIEINSFTVTSTHYYSKVIWGRLFNIIQTANMAIDGAKGIDASEEVKTTLEAEARVARAFIYFQLVQVFGDIPYMGEAVNEPNNVSTISKTPQAEVYQNIIDDLKFGIDHLPAKYSNNVRTRATSGTAATILASVYLTIENWQEAYNYAKWVVDRADQFGYALVSDYQDLFDATKQDGISEHIFAVDFLGQQRWADNDDWMGPLTGNELTGGWNVLYPSMAAYTSWDPRDYRKKVSIADTIVKDDIVYPYTSFKYGRPLIAKYWRHPGLSLGGARRTDENDVLYRYAEVLLIAAEAQNELSGPTPEAIGYVNQVRARARHWPDHESTVPADVQSGMSKDEFRNLILDDRRLEFAFEYKRWYDIKRRKLGDEVFKGPNSLEPHPNFDSSKNYLLPIPQTELDINPNLEPQNPGY